MALITEALRPKLPYQSPDTFPIFMDDSQFESKPIYSYKRIESILYDKHEFIWWNSYCENFP